MKIYLDPNKNYYKANLHCHTRASDGRAAPETVKEEYKKRGYSARSQIYDIPEDAPRVVVAK